MPAKIIYLSKSRLKRGLQCPKSLYFTVFKRELEPKVTSATQLIFDEGNEVGELARKQFSDGILIDNPHWDISGAAEATQNAIRLGADVIFEAAFLVDGLFARADILRRDSSRNEWEIIEIKKSTKVKEEHIQDLAIQALVLEKVGLKVKSYHLMHLNSECIFPNLGNLFCITDVTEGVGASLPVLKNKISELKSLVKEAREPEIEIGSHCDDPNPCTFRDHCWKDFPRPNVFDLPGVGPVKGWKLIEGGQTLISDLDPEDFKGKTRVAIEAIQKKKRWIEPMPIKTFVKNWQWPLYFLDFETLAPAVPRYAGCRPYSEIPFQFSCHVWPTPKSEVDHIEYLHLTKEDPRLAIADALVKGIGDTGSVVAYNMSVEKNILLKLSELFPKYRSKLKSIAERLVDPLPVFRNHVYDPNFNGSFSIKDVAPVLVGATYGYGQLEVSDGMYARAMAEAIICGKISGKESEQLKQALLEYCRQDTIAMVALTKWMLDLKAA